MHLPKNSVTNSADPLSVIALLSCFVAAIFQIYWLRKLGMKTARTGTQLCSQDSSDVPLVGLLYS